MKSQVRIWRAHDLGNFPNADNTEIKPIVRLNSYVSRPVEKIPSPNSTIRAWRREDEFTIVEIHEATTGARQIGLKSPNRRWAIRNSVARVSVLSR